MGFRFAYKGTVTKATVAAGATSLELPAEHGIGRQITLLLLPSPEPEWDWFLINPEVNIPNENDAATVILMRRGDFRNLAAEARNLASSSTDDPRGSSSNNTRAALLQTAQYYGLTEEQLESAIQAFGETENLKDQGIAAYLEGEVVTAEKLLEEAAAKQEEDRVETLQYLWASQYEQAKYTDAVKTLRKAVTIKPDDSFILGLLGASLLQTAEWAKAEPVLDRALPIDQRLFGLEHRFVASQYHRLASIFYRLDRFSDAERALKRCLSIWLTVRHRADLPHPIDEMVASQYRILLRRLGKSDAEARGAVDELKAEVSRESEKPQTAPE